MLQRKKCSNKVAPEKRETDVSECYKRGLKAGYRAAMMKSTPRQEVAQIARKAKVLSAIQKPDLNSLTLRQLSELGAQNKIPNYSKMKKDELITALKKYGRKN